LTPNIFSGYAPATSGNLASRIALLTVHQNTQKKIMQYSTDGI